MRSTGVGPAILSNLDLVPQVAVPVSQSDVIELDSDVDDTGFEQPIRVIGSVSVFLRDIDTLAQYGHINDTIVDAYFSLFPDRGPGIHIHKSFFYVKLKGEYSPASLAHYYRCGMVGGAMDMEQIYIPMCLQPPRGDCHWVFIRVVPAERRIYYYDSAAGAFSPKVYLQCVKDYLRVEAEAVGQHPVFRIVGIEVLQ